jgi:hypothetical protein
MFELLSLKVFNHQLDQSSEIGVHVDLVDYFSAIDLILSTMKFTWDKTEISLEGSSVAL